MTKIIDRSGKGAAIDATENDENLSSLSGINLVDATASRTVDIDDQNNTIEFSNGGAVAVTLDDIATIDTALHTDDFKVTIIASGAGTVVTITPDATDSFNTGISTIVLKDTDFVTLQTDSTGAIWNIINRADKLVFLDEQTASASAAVDLDTNFNAAFSHYIVELSNLSFDLSGDELSIQLKSGGAWDTGSNYKKGSGSGTEIDIADNVNADGTLLWTPAGTGLVNVRQRTATQWAAIDADINYYNQTINGIINQKTAGAYTVTSDIQGIRFFTSHAVPGLITTGTFRLYGVRW